MSDELIHRLRDESDLCKNEGAHDIALLLDDAIDALVTVHRLADSRLEQMTADRKQALNWRDEIERLRLIVQSMIPVLESVLDEASIASGRPIKSSPLLDAARAAMQQEVTP